VERVECVHQPWATRSRNIFACAFFHFAFYDSALVGHVRAKAGSAQVETNGDTWGLDGGCLSVCGLWNVDTSGGEDAVCMAT
jgi:hypothetical protein